MSPQFSDESESQYIIWFEDKGKGSIKNKHGETMWYNSDYAFEAANLFAESSEKNVLIQKGSKVWRVSPDGAREQIQG